MTTTFPDDLELDRQARIYVAQHRVGYSEALAAVVAAQDARPAAPPAASYVEASDVRLHDAAQRYALGHRVSYSEALDQVHAAFSASASATTAARSAEAMADAAMDADAKAYASRHNVSYSEALTEVAAGSGGGTVSFRESAGSAAQIMERQPIEIFRAGMHVDSAGTDRSFTAADLQGIATAYRPALHEAPLTLGHPDSDRPAYGWVQRLEATPDGKLLMHSRQVKEDFAQDVQDGRYKKRSASFYHPTDPANPTPGQWYLRHVAWLGAQAPAVKGLADVEFGASDLAITFQFQE